MIGPEIYRFILGFVVVIGMLVLGLAIALGKVEEKTSYGLTAIMAILAKVALDFSEWAFRPSRKDEIVVKTDPKP